MFQVDDEQHTEEEPIETYHLYVVREGQQSPSLVPVIISLLTLSLILAIGILTPYKQPLERVLIRVPAVLLPLKTFTTSIAVVPTGVKTYPAITAYGTLTITNGSILTEEIPNGTYFTGADHVEIQTDAAVIIPPGRATGPGYATVSAHAVNPGAAGNISPLDIDSVEGTSLFIRNLQPFSGGADSYSVKYIKPQDREKALTLARAILFPQTLTGLLESACKETVTGNQTLHVSWTCQYVLYNIPNLPDMKALSAKLQGKVIILEVVYVARPRILTIK
jgi:hypothetical protein